MATVEVYPREGATYPDANGVPITSAGAIVDVSKYITDALRRGHLLDWDPLDIYEPDDRTGTSGSGGSGIGSYGSSSLLSPVLGTTDGSISITTGYSSAGDGGGGQWYWDTSDTTTVDDGALCCGASSAGRWKRMFSGALNVKWFGALGDDNQDLVDFDYSVNPPGPISYTQQTRDGRAIIRCLQAAEAIGASAVYFPEGVYRVLGYIEVSFAIRIYGDGPGLSIVKTTDDAPNNVHGYGIIISRPQSYEEITVENMTFDGNVYERGDPGDEYLSYVLSFYDKGRIRLNNLELKNSSIDCLLVNLDNDNDVYFHADGLFCSEAYRNVISVIQGCNISIENSVFEKAGYPFDGTNPAYCLDIEPDYLATPLYGVKFSNCVFRKAVGVYLVGQVWSEATFVNCEFDGSDGNPSDDTYPFLAGSTGAVSNYIGCQFRKTDTYRGHTETGYTELGPFAEVQGANYVGCTWEGAAPVSFGPRLNISGCSIKNSLYPVILGHVTATTFTQNVVINGLSMLNVFDKYNYSGGEIAALSLTTDVRGNYALSNIDILFDPTMLPPGEDAELWKSNTATGQSAYGISSYANQNALYESSVRMVNISCSGYKHVYPAFAGVAESNNYLDWRQDGNWPSVTIGSPPADTAGSTAPMPGLWARNCSQRGS